MRDAIDLIKLIALHPEALDPAIQSGIKQLEILGKKPRIENQDQLKVLFTSDSFLEPFAQEIINQFTNEEIQTLLKIYRSEVMTKMYKSMKGTLNSVYKAMRKELEALY